MATVTHYIYSHYDPPQRKEDEEAVADLAEEDEGDPWLTESTFGASRRVKNALTFVPAVVSYDEVNNMMGSASSSLPCAEEPKASSQVSSWYKSLTRASNTPSGSLAPTTQSSPRLSPGPSASATPTLPAPTVSSSSSTSISVKPPRDKNNWFISNPISSKPSSSRSTPAPTLADILSREPPPERTEQPFVPPVFLHIGPSNKGFAMLQRGGWSEGEALGAGAARRTPRQKAREKRPARSILDDRELATKTEEQEIAVDDDDEIREVRRIEVVDLTLSESEEEEEAEAVPDGLPPANAGTSHNPTALLTPIATVLKSDRLGIGLKAKQVGPFKESKKRVTHNQAALVAHIKANEAVRMRKAVLGRGTKAFARVAKAEAEVRKRLLSDLNAD
ncbi:uncharacterized protein BXZ73DRAFT_101227 [Epithele typhae]|uniref:uncharacterized protein n=1 Tax=Epithele typhae TaxID=378194 RepID=UPI00200830EF|nr:uncharacterized protein BXZ73DRAFT_101227 [Epithele typhae]KAH9932685.1 hypothetical protein BXZ73DRAFT_101227 [Epithele typhae]